MRRVWQELEDLLIFFQKTVGATVGAAVGATLAVALHGRPNHYR